MSFNKVKNILLPLLIPIYELNNNIGIKIKHPAMYILYTVIYFLIIENPTRAIMRWTRLKYVGPDTIISGTYIMPESHLRNYTYYFWISFFLLHEIMHCKIHQTIKGSKNKAFNGLFILAQCMV